MGMCSIPNYKGPQELYLSQIKDDFWFLIKIGVEFISIFKIISRARILIQNVWCKFVQNDSVDIDSYRHKGMHTVIF